MDGFQERALRLRGTIENVPGELVEQASGTLNEVENRLFTLKDQVVGIAGLGGEHVWTIMGSIDGANDIILNMQQQMDNLRSRIQEIVYNIEAAADYYSR